MKRQRPGEKERRDETATLHSGVFHFNGPPGDWLTPSRGDPSPFRHNGPLHYLFVLANVLPGGTDHERGFVPFSTSRGVVSRVRAINRTSRSGTKDIESRNNRENDLLTSDAKKVNALERVEIRHVASCFTRV